MNLIESLTQVMVRSGATWVLWLLFGLSFGCVAVAVERLLFFRRARGEHEAVARLVPELRRFLRVGDRDGAASLLQASRTVEGRVVLAGMAELDSGPAAAEESMAAAIGLERRAMERRLLFLGTVGNNAPFIGLLGTVIGVVGAFEALGKPAPAAAAVANAMAPERVMSTIAEALVATAVGLVVAIPAVAIFNHFQGRLATAVSDAQTLGHVLLSALKSSPRPSGPSDEDRVLEGGLVQPKKGNGQPVRAAHGARG